MNSNNKSAITRYFRERKNKLEWIVFFLGTTAVLTVIVYLCFQWAKYTEGEPEIILNWTKSELPAEPGRYQLSVINKGGNTAEEVNLEASWWSKGKLIDHCILKFDYLPRKSSRKSWFSFHHPPASGDSISVRVINYQ